MKIKLNSPVTVNGRPARYAGQEDRGPGKGQGVWVKVNFAEKGKPADLRYVRPKAVAVAATS